MTNRFLLVLVLLCLAGVFALSSDEVLPTSRLANPTKEELAIEASNLGASTITLPPAVEDSRTEHLSPLPRAHAPKDVGASAFLIGGLVVVSVVDRNGQPLTNRRFPVELVVKQGVTKKLLTGTVTTEAPLQFAGLTYGALVTAQLAPGASLTASAVIEGLVPAEGAAPLELVLEIDGAQGAIAMGRLLDQTGAPWANAWFQYTFDYQSSSGSGNPNGRSQTNSDGVFELSGLLDGNDRDRSNLVSQFHFQLERSGEPSHLASTSPVAGPLQSPLNLGDIVLAPAPLLVSGRVIDSLGEPVLGARTRVYVESSRHHPLGQLDTSPTDESGRFEIYGNTVAGNLLLRTTATGYSTGPKVAFSSGERELLVVVQRAGSLQGSVIVDGVVASLPCSVEIQPCAPSAFEGFKPLSKWGGGTNGTWWDTSIQDGGEFGWYGLAPGEYNVRMIAHGSDDPIYIWDEVLVTSDELTLDVRMQNVDLKIDFPWLELEVVNPLGEPIEDASWALVTQEAGHLSANRLTASANGLYVPDLRQGLLVCAPGFLDAVHAPKPKVQRIILSPAPRVTLVLPIALKLPKSAYFAVALAPLAGPKHTPLAGQTATRALAGNVELSATRLGENRVELELFYEAESGPRRAQIPLPDSASLIVIATTLANQRFEIPVTQATIDQALTE